jgi:hypothetical protein
MREIRVPELIVIAALAAVAILGLLGLLARVIMRPKLHPYPRTRP